MQAIDNSPQPGPDGPGGVLNHQLLLQYKQLKKGLLKRLIDAYLDEAPRYFAKIRAGVESENFDDIIANCHTLKSCCGNLGVIRLARTCQQMEDAAKAKDIDEVLHLFDKLGPEAFDAEEALKGEPLELQEPLEEAI